MADGQHRGKTPSQVPPESLDLTPIVPGNKESINEPKK